MTPALLRLAEWALCHFPDSLCERLTREGLMLLGWSGFRKTPVVLLQGATRGSGQPGRLLVAGHEPWVRYLPQRFFQGQPTREPLGEYPLRALPPLLDGLCREVDLLVARIDRQSAQRVFNRGYVRVPEWIGARLRVPDDLAQLVRSGGSIRRDMVLVRRHQYHQVVTKGATESEYFFHSFYLPFTLNRHGDTLLLRNKEDLRRRAARGGILWVQRNGTRVAAVLFERKDDTLDLLALGTLDGNLVLEKEGAIAALYYFILIWAKETGCRTVDFRGARPSLCDGLLRYKSKWGITLCDKTNSYHDLLVRWHQVNPVVTEFLSHTPLIFRDAGGFSAIVGNNVPRERDVWVDGLRRCYTVFEWNVAGSMSNPHHVQRISEHGRQVKP